MGSDLRGNGEKGDLENSEVLTSHFVHIGCPVLKTPAPGLNTKSKKCRSMYVAEADTCKAILIFSLSLYSVISLSLVIKKMYYSRGA